MHDDYTDRLSDYLDDELDAAERADVASHVAACDACARTLEELRRVTQTARALPPTPPATDLWPGVQGRIETRTVVSPFRTRLSRRISFTVPQLVAAGLALMVLSGGTVWLAQYGGRATALPPLAANGVEPAVPVDTRDAAVADLQEAVAAGRSRVDARTVQVIDANLALIDAAIADSQHALAEDPDDVYLHTHFTAMKARRLALLRRIAVIAAPDR